jgi:methylenetetrahydrofolate dehydrogenase (NADP+)/methenyltetrahydrofolate cyclohydrolase
MAILLDGKARSRQVWAEVRARAQALAQRGLATPHLAAVLIGDDPASATYVGMKERACQRVGMRSSVHRLPASATQAEAEDLVASLDASSDIDGIIVQHPVPRGLDEQAILDRVSVAKDVDGLSTASMGLLAAGRPGFRACTPQGIMDLLDSYGIELEGRRAVVVGRSNILGKPMALLLLERHATVTICHSRTADLASVTRQADVLVAAAGRPELVTGDMIREGAIVVDAGYNKVEGRATDVGDVEFGTAVLRASFITPVPGGVGPMTIAMLLRNTVDAAEARRGDRFVVPPRDDVSGRAADSTAEARRGDRFVVPPRDDVSGRAADSTAEAPRGDRFVVPPHDDVNGRAADLV